MSYDILSTRIIKDESLTLKSQVLDTHCHHVRLRVILLPYGTILPMCACRLRCASCRKTALIMAGTQYEQLRGAPLLVQASLSSPQIHVASYDQMMAYSSLSIVVAMWHPRACDASEQPSSVSVTAVEA